jgi:NAD(P)-dependent dehydrogenase (short-subunit alcohol dehydrogenase family)
MGTGRSPVETDVGYDLAGKKVLITGASSGIGAGLARAFAAAGATVGICARRADRLAEVLTDCRRTAPESRSWTIDLGDLDAVEAFALQADDELGGIDLLVNNAGIPGPIGPLWEVDAEAWWATFDVNVRGIMLTTQAVLPAMVANRRGRIVNMASQAGVHRWPLMSGYSVSKAAVTKLTENLAHETARYGVSVFSVHPGLLPIGMSTTVLGSTATTPYDEIVQRWTAAQLQNGGGAEPSAAVELLLRVAAGDADALSGRHLSVHDDLDALLANVEEIRRRDLYVLRPERLRATATAPVAAPAQAPASAAAPTAAPAMTPPVVRRSNATPSSYLGRPAEQWRALLAHSARA